MFKKILNTIKLTQKTSSAKIENSKDSSTALISEKIDGFHTPKSSKELLDTPLRQQYLTTIWQNVSMTPILFDELYRKPIEIYAELVQLLPASESHHHAHLGGMLDHGLEVISIAVKLRQNYVLPQNAAPEEQARQRDAWTAVVIYTALLHDIGKIAVDMEIILENGNRWFPWQGKISQPYRFRYIKERDYELHPVVGGFLAQQFISQSAMNWIAEYPQVLSAFMYFISGQFSKADVLSEIIQKADQFSVTMALGGDIAKLNEVPKISFAKQLQIALRHVVSNYKLNSTTGGSDGWLTEDGLWLMSKTTADLIRAYLTQQGISAPTSNGKLFDELQAHKLIEPTAENMAIWNGKIMSNAGWSSPAKPFSLLRISPGVIWDNLNQRPALFEGRVTITNEKGETTTTTLTTNSSDKTSESMTVEKNETPSLESLDFGSISTESPTTLTTEADNNQPVETEAVLTPQSESSESSDNDEMDYVLELFGDIESLQNLTGKSNNKVEAGAEINDVVTKNTQEQDSKPYEIIDKSAIIEEKLHTSKQKFAQTDYKYKANPNLSNAENFVEWLKEGIRTGKLPTNRPTARVHLVKDHLFIVTPYIFQLYTREKTGETDKESWEKLQYDFQDLGLHKKQYSKDGDSKNIWTCSVVGPNRASKLKGYLLSNPKSYLSGKTVYNNHWLTLQGNLEL